MIFLSAKEQSLSVTDGIIVAESADFANEHDLLQSILYYGGWTRDESYLKSATIALLRADLKAFFNITSVMLVIDDVDTLTTKGIDPGSDFIYRTLCRSTRYSKVVYTLRNAPSQSLLNAIEVPGLDDDDFEQFVKECSEHFQVPAPSEDFIKYKLSDVSERRPLVIESVIALRRTSGSYDKAIELFQQQTGDTIRDYVFLREWDALRSNAPRLMLAALSEFNKPTNFHDLQSVLQFEPSATRDAIGAVREMFLQIDEAGSEALYSLAPLTKAFVKSKRSQLVGYGLLHERVKAFHRHVAVSNPRVANIATQVERLLPTRYQFHDKDKLSDARRIVLDRSLPPFVTEDPFFKTVLGYVLACTDSPILQDIRSAFQYAIDMKHEPEYKYIRVWFNAERNSGVNDGWCLRVADIVLNGKRYEERDKMEMIGRKATSLYARAQERLQTDSADAMQDLIDSLRLHLRAYRLYSLAGDGRADISERYARSTAFQLLNILAKSPVAWQVLEVIEVIGNANDAFLDPLDDPISAAAEEIVKNPLKLDGLARVRQRINGALGAIASERLWLSSSTRERATSVLRTLDTKLGDKQQFLRKNATVRPSVNL